MVTSVITNLENKAVMACVDKATTADFKVLQLQ